MKKIFISITLLPDKEMNSLVLTLNKELGEKFRLHEVDSNESEFAHISLYNATFPEHNCDVVQNSLREIFENIQSIELVPERINIKSRFVSVVFEKTLTLADLQDKILETLNPLREGLLQSKYTEKSEYYSQEELLNAHTYGYPFCKDQFSPHMTIAELENAVDGMQAIKEITWEKPITLNRASVRILFTNDAGEKTREVIYLDF